MRGAAVHPQRRAVPRRCSAAGGYTGRTACLMAGIALLAAGAAGPAAAQEVRLAYLTGDSTLPGILSAWKAVLDERPDLRDRIAVRLVTESLLDDIDPEEVLGSDVLVLHVHDQHTLDRFDETYDVDLVDRITGQGLVLGVGEGLLPREHYVERGVAWDRRARAFWEHSGFANQVGLLKYVLSAAGVAGLTVPEPQPSLQAGYYYPDPDTVAGGAAGRVFADWDAFDAWRRAAGKHRPGAPRVAVGFYGSNYDDGDTALIDAVIAEIERQGAEAIPIFGYPAGITFETLLLDADGSVRADVALAFLFRFAGPDAGESLRKLDIPVLSLISLYGRSEAEWRDSAQGLSMFEGDISDRRAGAGRPGGPHRGRQQGTAHRSRHRADHRRQQAHRSPRDAGGAAGARLRGPRRDAERRQAGGRPSSTTTRRGRPASARAT